MFCPRCGQQQLSDGVRFCPRCGLSLAAVPALLGEGAETAPAGAQRRGEARGGLLSGKRAGVRGGAKLMFFSLIAAPVAFLLCIASDSPVPLLLPLMLFLAGLAFMLYSLLFGEELLPSRWTKGREEIRGAGSPRELSAQPFVPASGFAAGQRVNTAEIAQPPSVTEQTTKLLDKD